jgi:hypothetical protein
MTDKEIKKALECCGKFGSFVCDEKCPVFKSKCETLSDCRLKLHKLSLDLINRQQAEIERLKHEREVLIEDIHHSADQINEQLEEIERLTINMNAFGLGMKREKERADTTRAEAIKEFAERYKTLLETELHWCECADETIKPLDNLVKEMAGEQE